jgi:DNA-binding LacI/PurR family transcriptional regulator
MPSPANEITIQDVAIAAGVSRSTVSRVLNNRSDVSDATRQRVLEVIEGLGFHPHAQAQRLATGRSHAISMLHPLDYEGLCPVDQFMDIIVMGFVLGVARAGEEQNYFFNILTQFLTPEDLLTLFQSVQVDGVIPMQIDLQDWRVDLLGEHNFPFVMIGRRADNSGLSFVDVDFEAGVLSAFDHLIRLGHENIGFLALPNTSRKAGYGPAIHSWQGYQRALEKHGLREYLRESDMTQQAVFEATVSLWREYPQLTALVTFNTSAVDTTIKALNHLGYRIPDDVSVVGFCLDSLSELISPRLTALSFPSYEMGYRAAKMLIQKLKGEQLLTDQILIAPELIIRDSTAPPPTGSLAV